MADSTDKRNWLLLIAIAALVMILWNDGPNLFHFHWNIPFWPIVIVAFAIWWMSGGKHRQGCCDDPESCCEGMQTSDAESNTESSDSHGEDEESANKG